MQKMMGIIFKQQLKAGLSLEILASTWHICFSTDAAYFASLEIHA